MHRDRDTLEQGLADVRSSPADVGTVELIVSRPAEDERVLLDEGRLEAEAGLVGDSWRARGNDSTIAGSDDPDTQLTLMNTRAAALIAGERERWALAGDQLFVDLDLGYANLPPGTRLKLGEALIEIAEKPHRGCGKFSSRFGVDALKFVNSDVGRELNLRGIYARVVEPGSVRVGDAVARA